MSSKIKRICSINRDWLEVGPIVAMQDHTRPSKIPLKKTTTQRVLLELEGRPLRFFFSQGRLAFKLGPQTGWSSDHTRKKKDRFFRRRLMPGEPRTVFYTRTSGLEVKIPDWMVAGECSIYLKLREREPRSVLDTRTTALEVRIPQSGWSLAIVTSTMVSVNDRP